jgi:hypothetical protein
MSGTSKNNSDGTQVLKKRGRKSKKDIELAQQIKNNSDNIVVLIEDNNQQELTNDTLNQLLDNDTVNNIDNIDDIDDENKIEDSIDFLSKNELSNDDSKPVAKKRGRKPKGGKIIQQITPINSSKESKPNVILHLKCSIKDLQTNILGTNIENYNFNNGNNLSFDNITNENNATTQYANQNYNIIDNSIVTPNIEDEYDYDDEKSTKENDIRDIWKKLKVLEHNLHINNICDKKSACFWCTYDFDNPPIYIPKHYIKNSYHVYGCFCSPECATAHLMEENIDSSAKFERYHMLNHIYCKIYDYNKNIKPAPNPFYMLDKYYGNLSIQEYRALLKNERLFLVVDKPLTRILPELHEDNDDFIINNKIIPSNTYQIKKKLQKKQTKTNILSERFGLNN